MKFNFNNIDSVLISGASGAIGQEIYKLLLYEFPNLNFVGTYFSNKPQNKDNITWKKVDFCDEKSINNLFVELPPCQAFINCVGILHNDKQLPEKKINELSYNFINKNLLINYIGPSLLTKNFVAQLDRNNESLIAHFSAKVASFADNKLGGWYSYRSSKAALNMMIKTLSIELERTHKNCFTFTYHPGLTSSKLSSPFTKTRSPKTAQTAAKEFIELCKNLNLKDSGSFFSYNQEIIKW